MKPLEALGILEQAAAQARLTLQDHALVRQAVETLKEAFAEVPKPEPAKSGEDK